MPSFGGSMQGRQRRPANQGANQGPYIEATYRFRIAGGGSPWVYGRRIIRCDDCGRWSRPGAGGASSSSAASAFGRACRPTFVDTGVGTDPLQPGQLPACGGICALDHDGQTCEEAMEETQRLIMEIRREIEEKRRQCEMILREVAAYGARSNAAPPA